MAVCTKGPLEPTMGCRPRARSLASSSQRRHDPATTSKQLRPSAAPSCSSPDAAATTTTTTTDDRRSAADRGAPHGGPPGLRWIAGLERDSSRGRPTATAHSANNQAPFNLRVSPREQLPRHPPGPVPTARAVDGTGLSVCSESASGCARCLVLSYRTEDSTSRDLAP